MRADCQTAFKNPALDVTMTDLVAREVPKMVDVWVCLYFPSLVPQSSKTLHATSGMTSTRMSVKKLSRRRRSPGPPMVSTMELNACQAEALTATRFALASSCMINERVLPGNDKIDDTDARKASVGVDG